MQANPGRFAYQLVFQTDDARQLLESDFERTVKVFMRSTTDEAIAKEDEPFQERITGLDLINGDVALQSRRYVSGCTMFRPRKHILDAS
jgi:hypothetical protein